MNCSAAHSAREVDRFAKRLPAVLEGSCRRERTQRMSASDKAKDKAQVAKGEIKTTAGRVTGNRSLEVEGIGDKVAGNAKQAGEKVKDAARSLKK
jgi:uncharacterized protein YjbJ (UPF0337 family)